MLRVVKIFFILLFFGCIPHSNGNKNDGNNKVAYDELNVALSTSERKITIWWEEVEGADFYRVKRKEVSSLNSDSDSQSEYKVVAVLPASVTSFSDNEVLGERIYRYEVEAVDGEGKVIRIFYAEVRTPSFLLLRFQVVSSRFIYVFWDEFEGAITYELRRYEVGEDGRRKGRGKLLAVFPSHITFYPDGSVNNLTGYIYELKVKYAWGESVTEGYVFVGGKYYSYNFPPSPSSLKAEVYYDDRENKKVSIKLTWERKGEVLGYKVMRCEREVPGKNEEDETTGEREKKEKTLSSICSRFFAVAVTDKEEFIDTIECCSKEYYYAVVAYSDGGDSWRDSGKVKVIFEGNWKIEEIPDEKVPKRKECDDAINIPFRHFPIDRCFNPDYPREKTISIFPADLTQLSYYVPWVIEYSVVNSYEELRECINKEFLSPKIASYVDFSIETILFFTFVGPVTGEIYIPYPCPPERLDLVYYLKLSGDVIFVGWHPWLYYHDVEEIEIGPIVPCPYAYMKPPFNIAVIVPKVNPSSVVMVYTFEDFCPSEYLGRKAPYCYAEDCYYDNDELICEEIPLSCFYSTEKEKVICEE